MMKRKAYEGVTDLADFENVMYKIEGEDHYLIATSEHPMAAMYLGETFRKEELPIKLCGISSCFRKEVGTHGKYTKGLFRVHNFNKIEQFIFCLPKDSWSYHEELQKNVEDMYKLLEIPIQVVNVCTGDIGSIAAKKYDVEGWMADGKYRELGSNSNCTYYQATRLNVRYKEGDKKEYVHTLNNTALATSRTMVCLLESHQQKDGSIKIPKALWKYTGFKEIKAVKSESKSKPKKKKIKPKKKIKKMVKKKAKPKRKIVKKKKKSKKKTKKIKKKRKIKKRKKHK